MGQSLIRAKTATADEFSAVFTMQLGIGVVVYLGFFAIAPWLATYLENPLYTELIRVSALSFLLRPFALMRSAWLNREMQFRKRALVTLASGTLTGASSIAMAAAGMGVWSLILSGLVGALFTNVLYAWMTPLRLRLRFDREAARIHSGFGIKITTNELLVRIRDESVNLILAKMAGPASVGLFNKAVSLARMPNRLITPPTGQTVFRAMSKVQDNLDQTRYMFHRTVELLTIYIAPVLVGMWWVAEPFIEIVYGHKWIAAAEPMKILILTSFFRIIRTPCGVVLSAQNRLSQEMVALALSLVLTLGSCIFGLNWGLVGVAWALFANSVFVAVYLYVLVRLAIRTNVLDLAKAIAPGLWLSLLMAAVLAGVHFGLAGALKSDAPIRYLAIMGSAGAITCVAGFLLLPDATLRTESRRWLAALRQAAHVVRRTSP
jgi:O-antigen/teichoic acid export membrane protein